MGGEGNTRAAPGTRVSGAEIHALAAALYPICRSITGDGVRQTLGLLRRHIELSVVEVPSGTAVFDWTVPQRVEHSQCLRTSPGQPQASERSSISCGSMPCTL